MGSGQWQTNQEKIDLPRIGLGSGGLMVKLFSVMEMISLEKEANASGLSYKEMMENAGRGIAEIINVAYSHIQNKNIFALIGSGNNGGDALVALSHLAG